MIKQWILGHFTSWSLPNLVGKSIMYNININNNTNNSDYNNRTFHNENESYMIFKILNYIRKNYISNN